MSMQWHDLLFAHWPVPVAVLRAAIPDELEIDTFDGSAWLGVVPFRMSRVRAHGLPAMPRVSAFPELNLRTYVRGGGQSGVWFFSLDAAEPLAVWTARRVFGLPYLHARIACARDGDATRYASERVDRRGPPAELRVRHRPTGDAFPTNPGTLEHFLTARYCLFARDRRGHVRRGDIVHEPWSLRAAEWEVERCDMARIVGIDRLDGAPHLMSAGDLTVRAWLPVRIGPR